MTEGVQCALIPYKGYSAQLACQGHPREGDSSVGSCRPDGSHAQLQSSCHSPAESQGGKKELLNRPDGAIVAVLGEKPRFTFSGFPDGKQNTVTRR